MERAHTIVKLKFWVNRHLCGEGCLASDEEQALLYQCVRCGAIIKSTELELGIRCPYCRYRVLKKVRPPVIKRVLAR